MICQGDDKYIPELKQMWKRCFPEDTDAFIDFYFNKVYKDVDTLLYLINDKPVASLQIIPYEMKLYDTRAMAGYISGAMTHPDFRGRGIMAELLNASFELMKERAYGYSFLIPQEDYLFDYYAKFGYYKAFPFSLSQRRHPGKGYKNRKHFSIQLRFSSPERERVRIGTEIDEVDIYCFMKSYSLLKNARNAIVLKSEEQIQLMLEDFFMEGGVLFYNKYGFVFAQKEGNHVLIKESFFDFFCYNIERQFLNGVAYYFDNTFEFEIAEYIHSDTSRYRGMIKSFDEPFLPTRNIYMSMMFD